MKAMPRSAAEGESEPAGDRMPQSRTIGELLYALAERYATVWFLLLLGLFCAASFSGSLQKHFWYDEISTITVASQPTWHRFVQAMPADANPPVSALLTRLSMHLFGITIIGVRLPPLVGFVSALIGVFIFVRREAGAVLALLAVTLVMAQPAWTYSFEARPYGLILGFLMLGMVSWQSATRAEDAHSPRRRTLALAGVAASVAGCILTHHLGVVDIGVPLLFGEGVRLYTRRRFDWPLMVTAVISAVCSLAVTVPMMHKTNALLLAHLPAVTIHRFAAYISLARTSLHAVLDVGLIGFLACIWILAVSPKFLRLSNVESKRETGRVGARIAPHIFAASVGLTLLIPFTFLLMATQGGWYFSRYGIGSILGIAILSSLVLSRQGRQSRLLTVVLLTYLACCFLGAFLVSARHSGYDPLGRLVYENKTDLPVVISDPLLYPEIWWYAPAEMKDRLVYLSATPRSLEPGSAMVAAALVADKPFMAAPMMDYDPYIASHDHFLLDIGPMDADLEESLQSSGYRVTQLESQGKETLFDVERERK
jgi:hypothetical protein